ncbi:MAG: thermonuclease family protein [Firmicutes bacterium]|nr:thermonuclease family protein [Bacillota bacterium]
MKKVVLILICFLFCAIDVKAETTIKKVSFVRCVDGDTAVFKVDEEEVKFRFLAIDTPETVHPTKEVEAYGKNASEYSCNKLTNAKEIIVEYEETNKSDKYGRSLGWIWVDGNLLQKELISVGYGEVAYIYGNYRYTKSLCLIQKEAKEKSLGLWADNKEEGYCATIDLTDVKDNIKYDSIGDNKELPKEAEKLGEVLESINNVTEKISDFTNENGDVVSNILLYLIIGAAIVSMIYKSTKK